ncbi:MAG: hypothetical protein IT233_02355 [Bacteroidia bacterium]|nr:hypothetical protein [Bacteroidia bacterium]
MTKLTQIALLLCLHISGYNLVAQDSLKRCFSAHLFLGGSNLNAIIHQSSETYGDYGAMFAPTKNTFNTLSSVQSASISYQFPIFKRILLGLSGNLLYYTAEINDRVLKPQFQFNCYDCAYTYNSDSATIFPGDSVIPSDRYYFRTMSLNLIISVPIGKSKRTLITVGAGRPNKNCIYRVQRVIYSNVDKGYISSSSLSTVRLFFGSVSTCLRSWEKLKLIGKIDFYYSKEIFGGHIDFYNTEFSATFNDFRMLSAGIGISF